MAEKQAKEHFLKESAYIVMEAGRKSWGAQCVCGWRSVLYDTEAELMAVVHEHMENPGPPPKKKRWWQKAFENEDRRRR